MLANGVIKYSVSPFLSPIMLQAKKSDEYRLSLDSRALDKVTVGDAHYMNRPKGIFNRLHGAQ